MVREELVTHRDFVKELRDHNNVSGKDADRIMRTIYSTIVEGLLEGNEVRLINIGKFKLVKIKERDGVLPRANKRIIIPAHTSARFTISQVLKKDIKNLKLPNKNYRFTNRPPKKKYK
jgi:nucleoid DNA-binding protein